MKKNLIFNLYLFLFIFTMINREFLFLGMDLRMVNLALGILLIFMKLIQKEEIKKESKNYDRNAKYIFAFFMWSFVSNISWFWNGLEMQVSPFIGQIILLVNNFFALIVFYQYKEWMEADKINKLIVFSCMVLAISFALVAAGYELKDISGSDVRSMMVASENAPDHKNLFGGNYRLAGYAEDPNYASIFFVIGILATMQLKKNKLYKATFGIIFAICLGYACSKTILLSCIAVMFYLVAMKIIKETNLKKLINGLLLTIVLSVCIIVPKLSSFVTLSTMETRFEMWNMASDMFVKSPLIGNGITSFKSYINEQYNGQWYVQAHNTYWQTIAETGIVGMILLLIILYNLLEKEKNNYSIFLTVLYILFAINFETIQLQVFVYIICMIQIMKEREEIEQEDEESTVYRQLLK